jgi:hypothetical protein
MDRWQPFTEDDITAALADRSLAEGHYLDVKRELSPGTGSNKEIARDMASFALDGGALLLGVEEDKDARTWSLLPQELAGLPERIERIALAGIDPPLFVIPRAIPSVADASKGYVYRGAAFCDGTAHGRWRLLRSR